MYIQVYGVPLKQKWWTIIRTYLLSTAPATQCNVVYFLQYQLLLLVSSIIVSNIIIIIFDRCYYIFSWKFIGACYLAPNYLTYCNLLLNTYVVKVYSFMSKRGCYYFLHIRCFVRFNYTKSKLLPREVWFANIHRYIHIK